MWSYQMQPLAEEGSRCIAYDRRAHGRSSDPGSRYDFDELADDLNCVIEALSLRGVILIAHSFASGEVVRYLSRHRSSRIAGTVFVSPAAIPFLLKTDDNPGGMDGALFEQLRTALIEDFTGHDRCDDRNDEPDVASGTVGNVKNSIDDGLPF
jgi:pimeloyl-ACP methyl ester carboxylesterase